MIKNTRKNKDFVQVNLRERLKKHLKHQRLQPYQFAEKTGVAQSTIYRLLSGINISHKNYQTIKKLVYEQRKES